MNFKPCLFWISNSASRLSFIPSAVTRVTIASVFIDSGWGKIQHLDKTIEFFQSIGVPMAHLQAPFVAIIELLCGALILVGLATRAAAVPLIVVMLVALRTAKWEDITGFSSLFEISEYLYIVLLTWVVTQGAGRFSLDQLLKSSAVKAAVKHTKTNVYT